MAWPPWHSDVAESSEFDQQEQEDDELGTTVDIATLLEHIGYGVTEIPEMVEKLNEAPVVKSYLMSGVITARSDLESVLQTAGNSKVIKNLQR